MANSISAMDLTMVLYGRTRSSNMVFDENNSDGADFKPGLYFAMSA